MDKAAEKPSPRDRVTVRDQSKPVPGVADNSNDPKGHGGDVPVDKE